MATNPNEPLVSVQALRALAALAVVAVHCEVLVQMLAGPAGGHLSLARLALGVDLFFVISGFVMAYSTRTAAPSVRTAAGFMTKRIIRVAPLYWLIMPLAFWLESKMPSWPDVVLSYAFVPFRNPSGSITPLMSVGWTLNYEMFFYAIFAISLLTRRPVVAATAAIVALVALGRVFAPTSAALIFWTDPIMLEFTIGMGVAAIYLSGFRFSAVQATAVLAIGLMLIIFPLSVGHLGALPPTGWRAVTSGWPVAAIFAAALLSPAAPRVSAAFSRVAMVLGDSSYALYLIHVPVILSTYLLWIGGYLPQDSASRVAVAAFFAAVGLSILVHYSVEKPLTRLLRRAA